MHYTNYTTPQLQLQLQPHYTNHTTLQLQLTTTTPPHYSYNYTYNHNYNYNCATPHYIQQLRWPLQLQPPVGPSVDSPCHPWVITTNLSYRFPIFETSAAALRGTIGI